jgi:hypothetical protein
MAAYLDYTDNAGSHHQYQHGADLTQPGLHTQAAMEIHSAATTAFREMADRSYTAMRFTPEGFVAENRMTFK